MLESKIQPVMETTDVSMHTHGMGPSAKYQRRLYYHSSVAFLMFDGVQGKARREDQCAGCPNGPVTGKACHKLAGRSDCRFASLIYALTACSFLTSLKL